MNKNYGEYRKSIYASINGTKGNLIKLKSSKLLKKDEVDDLTNVIIALEKLRITFNNNRFKKETDETKL